MIILHLMIHIVPIYICTLKEKKSKNIYTAAPPKAPFLRPSTPILNPYRYIHQMFKILAPPELPILGCPENKIQLIPE